MGDANLLILIFLTLLFSVAINVTSSLNFLLLAEILWVTLFGFTLIVGIFYDNLNILSLTFFFLVLSAIELGVGLILLLLQNLISRSTFLFNESINTKKFLYRTQTKLYLNKINWKV